MNDHKKTKLALISELQSIRKKVKDLSKDSTILERTSHFTDIDRLSEIDFGTLNKEERLEKILDALISCFDCDRAYFMRPCSPGDTTWQVHCERINRQRSGSKNKKIDGLKIPDVQDVFSSVLENGVPLVFDKTSRDPFSVSLNRALSAQSQMILAITPEKGDPWILGIHYGIKAQAFTDQEIEIFCEMGQRITAVLNHISTLSEILERQKKYRHIFNTMTQGAVFLDAEGRMTSGNPAATEILNLPFEKIKGDLLLGSEWNVIQENGSALPEEQHPCHIAINEGKPVRNMILGFRKLPEKSYRWIRLDAIPCFKTGNTVPDEVFITFSDITGRIKAIEKARMSAAVFENTADAVLITNEKGRIISVNKAFSRITGYSEKEALNQNSILLRSEKHDKDFFEKMGATLKETGLWQGEITIRRKDKEAFPAWLSITAVYNETGKLINHVSVFSDITPLKRSQAQVDFLAFHDPLTHLPNRLLFNDRLSHSIKRAQRKGHKVALIFLDLDHFKTINDSLGHPIGDVLLQQVAERIKSVVRQEDTVARLSGDEFVVIVDRIEPQGVTVLAHKLMATFTPPFMIKEHELHVTISMGITIYPKDGEDNATLIKNADTAMYQAKEEGRNNYAFYTPALTTAVFKRLTLETELHRAMKNNELVLYYQPQYSLKTGNLVGAEALIRWQHPTLGLLEPAQFIPFAEESDLIVSIGKWVLQTACKQTWQWQKEGLTINRIAVNISGAQFLRGEIVKTVKNALKNSKLKSSQLELEITESFFMKNTKWATKALDQLKGLGVNIAIDDFGTGYSSLSYLKRLPVNKLKIDRSFIRDLPEDINDKAIAQAVLALAHGLHHKVIAEGVETEAQKEYLTLLGCDESQGFLHSPPVPAEKFVSLI